MSTRGNYESLKQTTMTQQSAPRPALSLVDAIALIVGTVIGAGIFETPALVAENAGSGRTLLLTWLLGGIASLVGALCYAELATAYPHVGGSYFYLKRAFGGNVAFLFAWARLTVIQTGSIVLLAFVFGDYASQLLQLGAFSSSIYAVLAIVLLSVLNIVGLQQGKQTQNWLTVAKVFGLLLVIGVGLLFTNSPDPLPVSPNPQVATTNWGLAMLFVLLSYGGWNEAAYISAEIRNGRQNIVRSLLWSIGIITVIFLLINFACLQGLGLEMMAQSDAVAADLMRRTFGEPGAKFISFLIAISTLGAINATIFTGARTNFALGRDFSLFSFLGHWEQRPSTPKTAYLLQGVIALALVVLGTITRKGFETMVEYTAPVFWFFFLLSGISLLVLRYREPDHVRPFQVPFYPFTPLFFCIICGYLLYSSLAYTGLGAIAGIAVVGLSIPLLWWERHRQRRA